MSRRSGNRWVEVGDILIQKKAWDGKPFENGRKQLTGVVYEIAGDRDAVFVHWTPELPPFYRPEHGLLRVNIHNLYDADDIIKNNSC